MRPRILVVDDEPDLLWALRYALGDQGYDVDTASNAAEASALVEERRPDLILMDIVMPGIDGFELCRQLRRDPRFATIPVIFLTALLDTADRVKGLDEGADDFVSKPFELGELKARIRAVLRRAGERRPVEPDISPILEVDRLRLDLRAKSVDVRGTHVSVTPAEFALIAFLAAHPHEVFTARQLLDEVWGYPPGAGTSDLVRWHIKNIRRKIELDPQNPVIVRTVRRYGYMLDPKPQADAA
jgi:DNA-binding response OmpR family regulator